MAVYDKSSAKSEYELIERFELPVELLLANGGAIHLRVGEEWLPNGFRIPSRYNPEKGRPLFVRDHLDQRAEFDPLTNEFRLLSAYNHRKDWYGKMLVLEGLVPAPTEDAKVLPLDSVALREFPEFPGGIPSLIQFIRDNLNYPPSARDKGIEGRVVLSFDVKTDGELTNFEVIQGIGAGCEEEVIRIAQKMPRWKPGTVDGKAVAVNYFLPVSFKLD